MRGHPIHPSSFFNMGISKKTYFLIFTIFLLNTLILSCDTISTTQIKRILDNPRNYDGKSVSVSGEVADIFSFFVIKGFVVKDATGEILVVTDKALPKKGSQIKVRGVVKEAFSIGDQQLIVLVEASDKK